MSAAEASVRCHLDTQLTWRGLGPASALGRLLVYQLERGGERGGVCGPQSSARRWSVMRMVACAAYLHWTRNLEQLRSQVNARLRLQSCSHALNESVLLTRHLGISPPDDFKKHSHSRRIGRIAVPVRRINRSKLTYEGQAERQRVALMQDGVQQTLGRT